MGWDDDLHPRDEQGKFTSGGGGVASGSSPRTLRSWADAKSHLKKHEEKVAEKARVMGELRKTLEGKNPEGRVANVSMREHVRIAQATLDKHRKDFAEVEGALKAIAPEGMKVKGRVKELTSAIGKLVRKPYNPLIGKDGKGYKTAEQLQDSTGLRAIAGTGPDAVRDVKEFVENLKTKFNVIGEDNYIDTPNTKGVANGYRSHHLIIEHNGLPKEIQIRTARQNTHAEWAHHAYKAENHAQRQALKEKGEEIAAYGRKVSDHFYDLDTGAKKGSKMPDCPPVVRQHFGCVHHGE